MDELTRFCSARLDEEEEAANGALWNDAAGEWRAGTRSEMDGGPRFVVFDALEVRAQALDEGFVRHAVLHGPARALRAVEADRALLRDHAALAGTLRGLQARGEDDPAARIQVDLLEKLITDRAAIWSSHPDYKAARQGLPG